MTHITRIPGVLGVFLGGLALLAGCGPPPPAAVSRGLAQHCPARPGPRIPAVPGLRLPCLTRPAQLIAVSAARGRPELVNLWASWCGPCRRELPLLERARVAAGDRVAFLGVDVRDSRSRALQFLAAHPVGYPQLVDQDGALARALRFVGVPDTVIVDADGRVVYRHAGQLDAGRLRAALARVGVNLSLPG